MQKKKPKAYNDGIVQIYRKKEAVTNVKTLNDLEEQGKSFFSEMSIRQQDIEFAEQIRSLLTLKIAIQDNGMMNTRFIAVINNTIYAIIHVDRNKKKKELYIYLEEVRKLVQ